MSDNKTSHLRAALNAARNVANSKGGYEIGNWLNMGSSELGNLIVHGHAAPIYSASQMPPSLQIADVQQEANRAAMPLDEMKLDVQNVLHSEPITPQPTPAVSKAPQIER